MQNSRPSSRQLRQFETALQQAVAGSVRVNNTLLRELAAKRDAHLANLRWIIMNYIDKIANELFQPMQIYRVEGVYVSGKIVSHLVGAYSAKNAIDSVNAADNRIIKITSAKPTSIGQ